MFLSPDARRYAPGSKRSALAMNGTRSTPRTPFSETKARATIQRYSYGVSIGPRRCLQERYTALETRIQDAMSNSCAASIFVARMTAWVRLSTPSFWKIADTCALTVASETPSS